MRVIAFCNTARNISRIEAAFHGSVHDVRYLLANNARRLIRWKRTYLLLRILIEVILARSLTPVLLLLRGRLWISNEPVHHARTYEMLGRLKPDVCLHAMGVIYRADLISHCGLGILNAHIGKLPEFRGRSVMEWSLFFGCPTGMTVFVIDTGIDTGPLVVFEPIDVLGARDIASAKHHLFSQDGRLYRRAIDLLEAGCIPGLSNARQGHRFYVMSRLLTDVVAERLISRRKNPSPTGAAYKGQAVGMKA